MFWKISLRNVFRNKRRTGLSLAVVAFGVSVLYLVMGFISESMEATKQSMAQLYGAVQIADLRVFENTTRGYSHLIASETVEQINQLLDGDPQVTGYKQELGFSGLVGNEKGSSLLVASGFVARNAVEDFSSLITKGKPLSDDGTPQVILGRKLAASLDVETGDWINLATGTVTGNFNAASAIIVGVFKFNDLEKEGQLGYVSLPFAQKLVRTKNIERVVVNISDINKAQDFAKELKERLAMQAIDLEVRPWQELNPLYDQVKQFGDVFSLFTNIGVFILAFFGVLEVLTMSFLERTREVGTIRSVGTKRIQVFTMFLQEGLILGVLGGLLGVLLGGSLGVLINMLGLNWLPPGAIDPVPMYINVSLSVSIVPFSIALISTFLGTLYPAWKSARLNIVRSLSYV